jgi:aspartate 1-decarboxylase
MERVMFRSKIHRATVTDANLHYEGSITIDRELLRLADILPNEQVHVVNVTNGERLITYAIEGGPGDICLNGAAAHKCRPGDIVIIMAYANLREDELKGFQPRIVKVDAHNRARVPAGL